MAAKVPSVGAEAFEGDRLLRAGTVAVAFLARWCPFCRSFEPEFTRLADEGGRTLLIADVTDTDSPLWDRFGLEVVPTVVVFRDGRPIYRADGAAGRGLGDRELAAVRRALS